MVENHENRLILCFLVILPTFGPNRRRFVHNGQLRRYYDLPFNYPFFAQNCLVLTKKILKKYFSWFFVVLITFQAKWRRFLVLDITTAPIRFDEIVLMISIYVSHINIKIAKISFYIIKANFGLTAPLTSSFYMGF